MSQPKVLFFIGHPGTGKALFSKYLAEQLGWQFIGADFGLEFRVGQPIEKIIGTEGMKGDSSKELIAVYLKM